MWHNISVRKILDESVYLQDVSNAWTAEISRAKDSSNRAWGAIYANISDIFTKRNFQKHARSVAIKFASGKSLNNIGYSIELSTAHAYPIRSIMNDNAHVNRRAAQGRDPCRSSIRE